MLTRQHFILEADRLGKVKDVVIREQMLTVYSNLALDNNPRFDIKKFRTWVDHVASAIQI